MKLIPGLPLSIALHDSISHGGAFIQDATLALGKTWKQSIRSIGGFWIAQAEWQGEEKDFIFLEGLNWEVRVKSGGAFVWNGFLAEMRYRKAGVEYFRSWLELANRVQVIYSRIGANAFTNGGAESGAWTAVSGATVTQSTAWVSDGTYSCKIVTSGGANKGATIQGGISITAGVAYQIRVTTNVVSGTWRFRVVNDGDSSVIASTAAGTGQRVLNLTISDTNTYTGTVTVQLLCEDTSGEIYGDGGVFQEAPRRASSSWYPDASDVAKARASQSEFGVLEEILLKPGMSDAAANGLAQTHLKKHAWPRTLPPPNIDEINPESRQAQDKLSLVFYGYVYTLRNKFTASLGTATASAHVSAIQAESEFIGAGAIRTNSMSYQVDDRAPLRGWKVLEQITEAGDSSGNRWTCGVYEDKKLDYEQASTDLAGRIRGGRFYHIAGGELEPWFARPGYYYIDDMPVSPSQISGEDADDPHIVYLSEIEFDAKDWLKAGTGIKFKR